MLCCCNQGPRPEGGHKTLLRIGAPARQKNVLLQFIEKGMGMRARHKKLGNSCEPGKIRGTFLAKQFDGRICGGPMGHQLAGHSLTLKQSSITTQSYLRFATEAEKGATITAKNGKWGGGGGKGGGRKRKGEKRRMVAF